MAFDLPQAYSVPDRLFDGIFILPRHKLEAAWKQGKLAGAWTLSTPPSEIAGLGPFRLKEYVAGQSITLERNPYYWKVDEAGTQLPYLSELVFLFAGTEDNQVLRFQAGESDIINRVGARNFAALEKDRERRGYELVNAGSSLEYSFLFFNLADLPAGVAPQVAAHQAFLRRKSFRQAVSAAIDRDAIVRLVYLGHAAAMAGPVPPGNKNWINTALPAPARSVERARQLLAADGFKWNREGALTDPEGRPVEFSILTSNSNPERSQMATLIQDDLKQIGMRVNVVPLEFRSLLERVQHTHDFEACVLSLASPDADPNPDMAVWLSSGGNHLWNPAQKTPATAWEAEIDRLMRSQMVTRSYAGTQAAVRPRAGDRGGEPADGAAGQPGPADGSEKGPGQFPAGCDRTLHSLECRAVILARGRSPPVSRTISEWSNSRMVAECLAGNENAWSALLDRYKNLIYAIPLRYGAPHQDAADIFQAVCLDLFNELPRLRDAEALQGWLIRVTTHKCYHWKRRQIQAGDLNGEGDENMGAVHADSRPTFWRRSSASRWCGRPSASCRRAAGR